MSNIYSYSHSPRPTTPRIPFEYIQGYNTYKEDNKSRSKEMIFSHTQTQMKWLLFLLIFVHEFLYMAWWVCVLGGWVVVCDSGG